MKTVKRIIAVVLFIVVSALVGYLIFTGSRLTAANGLEITESVIDTRSAYYEHYETQENNQY